MSERDEIWPNIHEELEEEEAKPATLVPEMIVSINADTINIIHPQDIAGAYELSESHAETSGEIDLQTDEHNQFIDLDDVSILQAVVFIEDACQFRTINHKIGPRHLWIYRKYQSFPVTVFRFVVIFALHMLAFLEHPSSLTITSDLRSQGLRPMVPCWVTQFLEFIFLSLLLMDNIIRVYLVGYHYFLRQKWDVTAVILLVVSFVDWLVSSCMACSEPVRVRRLLRPFFILQNSSLMKKIAKCLQRTLPEVLSVLVLLTIHIIFATMFAMLLFPIYEIKKTNATLTYSNDTNSSIIISGPDEGMKYFNSLMDSFVNLLILLTTANHPDVTLPAYGKNRFASIFFIIYLIIGLYFLMNMLLAIIYNQFRGYFLSSMQTSLVRRRLAVRAAFEVLSSKFLSNVSISSLRRGIGVNIVKRIVEQSDLPKHVHRTLTEKLNKNKESKIYSATQFQELFLSLDDDVIHKQLPAVRWFAQTKWKRVQRIFVHKYFTYFGMLMVFVNLIIITVQLGAKFDSSFRENHSTLRIFNFTFVMYYLFEQVIKVWANGWRRYIAVRGNIFDAVITAALVIGETVSACLFGIPYFPSSQEITEVSLSTTMWNILRLVNILIMVRLFRAIPHIRSMAVITTVLVDLLKNLKAFSGILVAIFYTFAIFGMQLFHGVIKYQPEYANKTFPCGTYEQLDYWANNFDDFFSSLIVLWDLMVVNNWNVFLKVYRTKLSSWSYLYFIAWWLLSVIIVVNLFTALIMENFIIRWDRRRRASQIDALDASYYEHLTISVHLDNVHNMFKDLLQEPDEAELLLLLREHRFLKLESQ
ncbi:two pore calcium channel protein 2 [Biomphalaria pfeifferi]|uniref:Two pore calcium channel protein 2 n=1 Tax=Biomphalaria pfeifferi TaxID=112525 RepID=A0AAD8FGQ4_BIOPF|nr:two pore calcium channel protein 2 [Biomphalaria pfeifferi]